MGIWGKIHTYTGLAFGLVLILQAVSGLLLVFQTQLLLAEKPIFQEIGTPDENSFETIVWASNNIHDFKAETIMAPGGQLGIPAYVAIGHSKRAGLAGEGDIGVLMDQQTGEEVDAFPLRSLRSFIPVILHQNLIAGEIGKSILAILGLVLAGSAMTGIILWWPGTARKARMKASRFDIRGPAHRKIFQLHSTLGFWLLFPTLMIGLTGAMMERPGWFGMSHPNAYAIATERLNFMNGSEPCERVSFVDATNRAFSDFPNASLVRIDAPRESSPIWRVMLKTPGDTDRIVGDISAFYTARCLTPIYTHDRSVEEGWLAPRLLELHSWRFAGPFRYVAGTIIALSMVFFPIAGLLIWLRQSRLRRAKRNAAKAVA